MSAAGASPINTPRAAYVAGSVAVLPFLAGTVPFGIVTGIATRAAGLSLWESVALTLLVFSGTAQIAALPLMVAGAPPLVVVFTALVISLRFVIYSAAAAPHFRKLSLAWRLLLGYFNTDTGFALFMRKMADQPDFPQCHWYYLGGGNMVALSWIVATIAGILAGAEVPAAWRLEFAATLAILALMGPFVRSRPELVAAIVGGAVALAAAALPLKLGLVCGAIAGIAAGTLAERGLSAGVS